MKKLIVFLLCVVVAQNSFGHGRWIKPSHTILSGEKAEVVNFDFSISNDVYHSDYSYGGIPLNSLVENKNNKENNSPKVKLKVTLPDGSINTDAPIVDLYRKSVSAFKLEQSGTYRVGVMQPPIHFTWFKNEKDEWQRFWGTPTQVKDKLPENAKNLHGSKLNLRVETYITRNELTTEALAPEEKGLELVFDEHPNDLFVGETSNVTLLLNGKAVDEGVVVSMTQGGTRYRNNRNVFEAETDKKGRFEIPWKEAGMYLIQSKVEADTSHPDYAKEVFVLHVSVEVNPE